MSPLCRYGVSFDTQYVAKPVGRHRTIDALHITFFIAVIAGRRSRGAGLAHELGMPPTLCLKNDVLLAFPPSDLEVLSWQDVTRFPIRVGH